MHDNSSSVSPLGAILSVGATYILVLFAGAALVILFGLGPALVFTELLVVAIPLGYMIHKGVDARSYVKMEINARYIILGIALGIPLFLFDLIVSNVLVSIFGVSQVVEESSKLLADMSRTPQGLFLLAIALSLAGICEEFTFRGFLQNAINSRYSLGAALIISSAAFGLLHFDTQAVYTLSAFFSGLLLGYIYYRWNSYVVSALAHTTLNLVILILIVLV